MTFSPTSANTRNARSCIRWICSVAALSGMCGPQRKVVGLLRGIIRHTGGPASLFCMYCLYQTNEPTNQRINELTS